MLKPRIIPCLLLHDFGLVKTREFKDPKYIGDPINAVRIFNKKEADEIIFLDIDRARYKQKIDLALIERLSDECFMPLAVGGGIRTIDEIKSVLATGVEKVIINTGFFLDPSLVKKASEIFGSQSIVVCLDVKKVKDKYKVYIMGGQTETTFSIEEAVILAVEMGAGEIMINSIDHDGQMRGYDLNLIKKISKIVSVPLIACGGAGHYKDLAKAIKVGASAAAAGSIFVFYGARRAVLINFPTLKEIKQIRG